MYKLAVISDLHADVHALADALEQIKRIVCNDIICLGDLVDYGVFAEELISRLRQEGITAIRGNHDAWASDKRYVEYDLSEESINWLDNLPTSWSNTIDGIKIAAYHGSPKSHMDGIYPEHVTVSDLDRYLNRSEADILLVGHTHIPFRLSASHGRVVANPGSLLRDPADDHKSAIPLWNGEKWEEISPMRCCGSFGILELSSKKFTVHRAKTGEEIEITRSIGLVSRRRVDALRVKGDAIS